MLCNSHRDYLIFGYTGWFIGLNELQCFAKLRNVRFYLIPFCLHQLHVTRSVLLAFVVARGERIKILEHSVTVGRTVLVDTENLILSDVDPATRELHQVNIRPPGSATRSDWSDRMGSFGLPCELEDQWDCNLRFEELNWDLDLHVRRRRRRMEIQIEFR